MLLIESIVPGKIKNVLKPIIPAAVFFVRFTSFKNRTFFYWNRNKKTKKRYEALKNARSAADENQDVNYVLGDVNCQLKVVFKDGISDFFRDVSKLNELI